MIHRTLGFVTFTALIGDAISLAGAPAREEKH